MAEHVKDPLYTRGEDDDEGIWDDSALIAAYDRAVSIMQLRLEEKNGGGDSLPNESDGASKKKAKKKKQKKRKPAIKKSKKWTVGDRCRAAFTEDGLLYDSVIISMDSDSGTCVVRYSGYGNEEQQKLSDLLPPSGQRNNHFTGESEDAESDGAMNWYGHQRTCRTPGGRRSSKDRSAHCYSITGHNGMTCQSHCPATSVHHTTVPPFASFPSFPMTYTPPASFPPSMTPWMTPPHVTGTPPRIPSMPPPPTPAEDLIEGDNEALSAMLISWYMSGYHTGYYQGLKQGKKQSSQVTSTTQNGDDKHS